MLGSFVESICFCVFFIVTFVSRHFLGWCKNIIYRYHLDLEFLVNAKGDSLTIFLIYCPILRPSKNNNGYRRDGKVRL
jgi:hypothetical protein